VLADVGVPRSTDVRGNRDPAASGSTCSPPIDVLVGVRVLRRDGMRAEPGRDAACRADGLQLRSSVSRSSRSRSSLERRRAVREHRVPLARHDRSAPRANSARGARRRGGSAARGGSSS
jgi:hypothetical protein